MNAPLRGIVAYPLTPFTDSGRVDEALLGRIVDDMVGAVVKVGLEYLLMAVWRVGRA